MDEPRAEVEIKPQVKPRGSVAKEEDPKHPHQMYKWQIKSTRSTKQPLCLEYIKPLRAPTKETALALIAVDIGGKNTQGRTRLESEQPPHRSRDQYSVGWQPREVR